MAREDTQFKKGNKAGNGRPKKPEWIKGKGEEHRNERILSMSKTVNTPANRPDKFGEHRTAFDKAKRRILQTQECCGICGKPVDKSLRFPHPLSACIDHIVPIAKGGHPSDISNLQLAHLSCNRAKSDKINLQNLPSSADSATINNRDLPQSMDWRTYRFE